MAEQQIFPQSLAGFRIHLVGIKGTGMAALAEILSARGARVSGSDTSETFYTDALLRKLSIPFAEGFAPENLPPDTQLVVHSAAYRPEENPELLEASARGIPMIEYPQALGELSRLSDSSGVSGVHGKSTTTALCGVILKSWGMPATVLVGAEVPAFGARSTLIMGSRYFVAETCEYRRHFLNFHPARILITSVEPDHLDYFKDQEDLLDAFAEYGALLPVRGQLVYCADEPGAASAALRILSRRDDLVGVPYGRSAQGPFRIVDESAGEGCSGFALAGWQQRFSLKVPGAHTVLNAAGALALCSLLWSREHPRAPSLDLVSAAAAISDFNGSRRRSEVVGEAAGVLFLDDYAHHPTAITATLQGFKRFYPKRRLIVDFMSHTYSRTRSLLHEFGQCFASADLVVLHRIYASARESNEGGMTGRDLFNEVSAHHGNVRYFEEPREAVPFLTSELQPGDLFVTMGAGDNWKLGRELLRSFGVRP
ncbi:MAG TPA: UDP-N-acetylmuramate--L-alanine ligase [Spirochaetia bacterium]|nr:UDP-N-acetylmuramate--L-alanine ligase [Spirochaetia bacterium]